MQLSKFEWSLLAQLLEDKITSDSLDGTGLSEGGALALLAKLNSLSV